MNNKIALTAGPHPTVNTQLHHLKAPFHSEKKVALLSTTPATQKSALVYTLGFKLTIAHDLISPSVSNGSQSALAFKINMCIN